MSTFTEKILVKIDVIAGNAGKGLKDFKSSVAEAEGATGKLKAGAKSLGSTLSGIASSPTAVAAGVSAMGVAAYAAVSNFADLGVRVGEFSDATGLSTEESSRWLEVTDQMGVDAGALEGALNKMNKAIDPALFSKLGIEIAKTSTGATDVNQTFLNVADKLRAIQDPAERARVGTQLLGKSWTSLSEIIMKGSASLKSSLADVADVKVFDKNKVNQSREFRDMLDDLKDVGEEVALQIGSDLLPMVVGLGKAAVVAAKGAGYLLDALKELSGLSGDVSGHEFRQLYEDVNTLGDAFYKSNFAVKNGIEDYGDLFALVKSGELDYRTLRRVVDEMIVAHDKASAASSSHGAALRQEQEYIQSLTDKNAAYKKTLEDDAAASDRAKEATKELAKSVADLNDIQLDGISTKLDSFRANLALTEQQQRLNDILKDSKATTEDQATAALDMAETVADAAAATEKLNGHTQTATERNGSMVMTLTSIRDTLAPDSPLRKYLDEYIASLLKIPTNVSTRISITGAGAGNAGRNAPGFGQGPDGTRSVTNGVVINNNINVRTLPTQRELIDTAKNTARRTGVNLGG